MDYAQRDMSFQTWNLHTRRVSLLSDTIRDYQDNMRNIIRILGREVGPDRNYHRTPRVRQPNSFSSNAWMRQENEYQPTRNDPMYSFTRMPTPTHSPNGLTSEQIANVTQTIPYDASMNETLCPITWDPFVQGQEVLRINNCRHIFGQHALVEWFQSHNICPVCRSNVRGVANSGNLSSSSSSSNPVINQIITGIITSLNGALNDETGLYENEFVFNLSDLMEAYNPSLRTTATTTESDGNPNIDTPPNAI